MAGHSQNPLSHVLDSNAIELPWPTPLLNRGDWSLERTITLPSIFGIQITRLMVMEIVAAGLMIAILVPVVRHVAHAGQQGLVSQHVRGDAALYSRRRCPPVDRRPRGRSIPAVSVDRLLLRALQQSYGDVPRRSVGDGKRQCHRGPGLDDLGRGDLGRDARWGPPATGSGSCPTWTFPN